MLTELRRFRELADKHKLLIHMDGARLWNACITQGLSVAEVAAYTDSLAMCFSKGLGAPIGSVIVGMF